MEQAGSMVAATVQCRNRTGPVTLPARSQTRATVQEHMRYSSGETQHSDTV